MGWTMSTFRTDFHATVSGGAAMDDSGTVAMAFMGTGVYLFQNGMVQPHPTEGPVTDSISRIHLCLDNSGRF